MTGTKATETAPTVVSSIKGVGVWLSCLLQHCILKHDHLKICSAGAANTDAPSHARTAYAVVTEYNKKCQQVKNI